MCQAPQYLCSSINWIWSSFPKRVYQQRLSTFIAKSMQRRISTFHSHRTGVRKLIEKHGKVSSVTIPTLFLDIPTLLPRAPSSKKPFTTGIGGDLDLKSSLETALSLHPATRTAFVITGASAHDRFLDAVAGMRTL